MSFYDSISELGTAAVGFITGDTIGSSLARVALTGLALNQISKQVNAGSTAAQTPTATGINIKPAQDNKIPVLYGESYMNGIITDAQLSSDRQTMSYVFTISECTGPLFSTGLATASSYTVLDMYLNNNRVVFLSDGVTVNYTVDSNSVVDYSLQNLVTIRMYAGNSLAASQLTPANGGYTITPVAAYDIMPGWDSSKQMNNLIFAVITQRYNSGKNSTSLPSFVWHLANSMTLPGDVIYDYATNNMYGAGINPGQIYTL